jgi:enoyl-CoA hydratase/carnithine racemase
VNKVVPIEELDSAAEEIAGKFLKMSGLSVKLVREAFYRSAEIADLDIALDTGVELGIESWETHDGQEGLKAYLEKRNPEWTNN